MSGEHEERTVEVLGLPEGVDEELLSLYFANKRRSGGGPLVSVMKDGDRAFVVFEEVEVAARVLSAEHHVIYNAEITVRKPAAKDRRRLVLRGVHPHTCLELVELYVENIVLVDFEEYTLIPSPGRDVILIHLHEPLSKDFHSLSARVSKKPLEGSRITLEQVEHSDSVLVEDLLSGVTVDMLTQHFENSPAGDHKVKEVVFLSDSAARVSFVHSESVEAVLNQPHKLNDLDLTVSSYYAFNQPPACQPQSDPPQDTQSARPDVTDESETQVSGFLQTQISSPIFDSSDGQALQQTAVVTADSDTTLRETAQKDSEELEQHPVMHAVDIAVTDPVKLDFFQMSTLQRDIHQAHPDVSIQVENGAVRLAGPDEPVLHQINTVVSDFIGGIAQARLTFDPEKTKFLENEEVKGRLCRTLSELGAPTIYAVLQEVVVLTSVSQERVSQACVSLPSQLCAFSIPMDKDYECMLYSEEWSAFLQTIGLCSTWVTQDGGSIEVLTLKGLEDEKRDGILEFLRAPVERERFIYMEPGMLTYVQMHHHQLLADMNLVSIVPMEGNEVCGLRIHGKAGPCQNAEEVLRDVVSSVYTRTITVNQTGVARFLLGKDGTSILDQMRTKFLVCINLDKVLWKPLQSQDIFEAAWKNMSYQNFQKVSSDGFAESPTSVLTDGRASDRGLIEEAKQFVSAIDDVPQATPSDSQSVVDCGSEEEEEDIYTAGDAAEQDDDMALEDATAGLGSADQAARDPPSSTEEVFDLEEQAQLSLAIQYSMESNARSRTEEDELRKALELSKHQTSYAPLEQRTQSSAPSWDGASRGSLLRDMEAGNTAQVDVFAGVSSDLIRVSIALEKKVTLKQVEEKVEQAGLGNMSAYQRQCVEVIKRKHAVDVQAQGNTVTLSGFKDFVDGALPDLHLLLRRIASGDEDKILRTLHWAWQDPSTLAITPYAPQTIVFIENAWRTKEKKIDILLDSKPHVIDFEKMQEHNVASGKSMRIVRTLLGVLDMDGREEEYSLLSRLPDVSRVDESSNEFQDVVKDFYTSIKEYHSKIRIVKVEKLCNRLLYNQYRLKKASLCQSAENPEVERTLYHGTSVESVKEIYVHGFNRSFCGKNATLYGQGVYFAVTSAMSVHDQYSPPDADGCKFIFVAKVLTGDYTTGCHSMKAAPLKETADIPLRYDSVTDNLIRPSMFVIFNDTQAYPEYLITCQKVHR